MAHTKLSITVPHELVDLVSQEMQTSGRSKSAVITEILRSHFNLHSDQMEDHEHRITKLEEVAGL